MVFIDTGLFAILAIFAFGFMLLSFRIPGWASPILMLMSILVFAIIGLFLLSGYGVQATTIYNDGITTWTETDVLIAENAEGFWFGWIFMAFMFLNMFFMYMFFFQGDN